MPDPGQAAQSTYCARGLTRYLQPARRPLSPFPTQTDPAPHGTTQRIVSEAFAAEQPELQPLPATAFDALLKLERRVSHDGFVSIGGNYYSVPDRSRRVVEVHQLPDTIRILDQGRLVASHPVLEGRRQYQIDPSHRQGSAARAMRHGFEDSITMGRRGDQVARRSLDFYQAIGDRLAGEIGGRS
jgi:hypothetical protein